MIFIEQQHQLVGIHGHIGKFFLVQVSDWRMQEMYLRTVSWNVHYGQL